MWREGCTLVLYKLADITGDVQEAGGLGVESQKGPLGCRQSGKVMALWVGDAYWGRGVGHCVEKRVQVPAPPSPPPTLPLTCTWLPSQLSGTPSV